MVTLVNRAKVSTATTGTGTITLGAAESGYQTFADAGVADGNVVRYVIEDNGAWEIGTGTYTASGTTLTRTVSESSNADAAINLSGSALVYVSATEADLLEQRVGTVTGSATLDLSTGTIFDYTPTADTTFVFSNPPANGTGYKFDLKVTGVFVDNAYDIANATWNAYDPPLDTLDVSAQVGGNPRVFFKPDGTKLYVCASNTDSVYEYDLSVAWDVTTATYLQSFSFAAQAFAAYDMKLSNDGTKLYIIDASAYAVNQYDLSTAWDISTATFTQLFDPAESTVAFTVTFKEDGTKMYISDGGSRNLYEYDLSTAWDVSTTSYVQLFYFGATTNNARQITFKADGTKMYMFGYTSSANVAEYTLSTAWNISTASYTQVSSDLGGGQSVQGGSLKSDGTEVYAMLNNNTITAFPLSTAWNITTTPSEVNIFDASGTLSFNKDVAVKSDGTKFYMIDSSNVYEFDMSTAWDLTTAAYLQAYAGVSENIVNGFTFSPDGTKMYVSASGTGSRRVSQHTLSTAWNISTATYIQSFVTSTQDPSPNDVFFKTDGTKMYVAGGNTNKILEYDLSVAWDISTSVYLQAYALSGSPSKLQLSPDGTTMVVDEGGNLIKYTLSTAWNVSTASYVTLEYLPSGNGFAFDDLGTRMFFASNNTIVKLYDIGQYGGLTLTYPASVQWPSGVVPTAPANGEIDTLQFVTLDGGTAYYGRLTGDNYS